MFAFTSAGEGLLPTSGTCNNMKGLNRQSCDQRETGEFMTRNSFHERMRSRCSLSPSPQPVQDPNNMGGSAEDPSLY